MAVKISLITIELVVINQFNEQVNQHNVGLAATPLVSEPKNPRRIFGILLGFMTVAWRVLAFMLDGGTGFFEGVFAWWVRQ